MSDSAEFEYDMVAVPPFDPHAIQNELDETTDFFPMNRDGSAPTELLEFSEGQNNESGERKSVPPLNDLVNVKSTIAEVSDSDSAIKQPIIVVPSVTAVLNPDQLAVATANIAEAENIGRLAMFGNRKEVKRRSELRKEALAAQLSKQADAPTSQIPVIRPRSSSANGPRFERGRSPVPTVPSAQRSSSLPRPRPSSSIGLRAAPIQVPKTRTGPVTRSQTRQMASQSSLTEQSVNEISSAVEGMHISRPRRSVQAPVRVARTGCSPTPTAAEFKKALASRDSSLGTNRDHRPAPISKLARAPNTGTGLPRNSTSKVAVNVTSTISNVAAARKMAPITVKPSSTKRSTNTQPNSVTSRFGPSDKPLAGLSSSRTRPSTGASGAARPVHSISRPAVSTTRTAITRRSATSSNPPAKNAATPVKAPVPRAVRAEDRRSLFERLAQPRCRGSAVGALGTTNQLASTTAGPKIRRPSTSTSKIANTFTHGIRVTTPIPRPRSQSRSRPPSASGK